MSDVTRVLSQIEQGDPHAAEVLLPLVYEELRKLARSKLQHEQPGHTLEATALVHEAYLRLVKPRVRSQESGVSDGDNEIKNLTPDPYPLTPSFHSRSHFFAAAAEAMRRILVESARRKSRLKHGGDLQREPIEDDAIAAPEIDADLLALDAALDKLAAKDPRKAELVKLRYFAGLTQEQAAEVLDIGISTADRDWSYARAWLFREISR
jgi:RNA polymerase sigma factor (sigma-70 family)